MNFLILIFRKERIRTLGLSQPNLNTLINQDENIEEETSSYENKNKLLKMNSNPNLSQNCKSNNDDVRTIWFQLNSIKWIILFRFAKLVDPEEG